MESSLVTMAMVTNVADLMVIGKAFATSGMFGCTNEQQGMVLALTCKTEGISPLKFCQTYHMIEGRPSMRADAMLAKFVERGGKFIIGEKSEKRAAIRLIKDGNDVEFSMTLEQAMKEPFPWYFNKKGERVLKHTWATPWMQKCMLWARVVSDGVRTVDPGVNMGVYTPEEVQDFTGETISVVPLSTEPSTKGKKEKPEPTAPISSGRGTLAEEESKGNLDPEKLKKESQTPTDYNIFPAGKLKGTKFSDADDKTLEFVLTPKCKEKYSEFEEGHFTAVKNILADRAAGKDQTNTSSDPFPEEK